MKKCICENHNSIINNLAKNTVYVSIETIKILEISILIIRRQNEKYNLYGPFLCACVFGTESTTDSKII